MVLSLLGSVGKTTVSLGETPTRDLKVRTAPSREARDDVRFRSLADNIFGS